MAKPRTKKAASKRFKITKNGKIIQGHSLTSHLQAGKSKSRQRRQNEPRQVSSTNQRKLEIMLPFS